MLTRRYRLPTSFFREQAKTKNVGNKVSGKDIVARVFPSQRPYSRFCVVVARTAGVRSVGRNRLRRVIYDWIRRNRIFARPSQDIVLIPRAQLIKAPVETICRALEQLFNRR